MNEDEQRAKELLIHYMKLLFEATGLHWDSDNAAEIEDIVEYIIAASKSHDVDPEVDALMNSLIDLTHKSKGDK